MSVDTQVKEVVQESREWVEDQIEELSKQVKQLQKRSRNQVKQLQKQSRKQLKQLQKQSRKLRKSLRLETRKRRIYWNLLQVFLLNSGKYLQNRGENLRVGLVERGGKVTRNKPDVSSQTTQDNAEQREDFKQALAKQGQRLLDPLRRRDRIFWSILGFSVGLVAAATITYQFIRRRVAQQEIEQDEHIELPLSDSWNGSGGLPIGEIGYIDQGGNSVATLEIVDIETSEQPSDAAFVGIKSTKLYYPVDTELEQKDLVYFTSEEEAKAQGFSAAQ
ncbi:MAG TPA: hypothetical protein VE843_15850 [Ktedonobacteraceae bacterium]|nr:hypothetical protein [Ktedonobacteraceae bacterium]